jgi:hypothetical protein
MKPYRWRTDNPHFNNTETMGCYLDFEMPQDWVLTLDNDTYAEIIDSDGLKWGLHASGDGDSFCHKIEFEQLE